VPFNAFYASLVMFLHFKSIVIPAQNK